MRCPHAWASARPSSSLWGDDDSEADVYLTPYMDLAADTLFIADDRGALTGYLTGCVDSAEFPSESERFTDAIKRHRQLLVCARPSRSSRWSAWDVAGAKLRGEPVAGDFVDPRWPAHLHINVVPEVRGTRVAAALMDVWQTRLRELHSPGCHLQTLIENVRAVRFFEKAGFVPHGPTPVVPGLRHEGKRVRQQTMVWQPG